jgi:hypothetical protein
MNVKIVLRLIVKFVNMMIAQNAFKILSYIKIQ